MAEVTITDKKSLLAEVNRNIDKYDNKKDLSRSFAVGIKLTTAVLGAAVAVLLGWKHDSKTIEWMTNLALVFGASIPVMNTVDAFFSFSDRWTHYKNICTQLSFIERDANSEELTDLTTLGMYKTRLNNIVIEARKGEAELHKKRKP